MNFDLVTLRLFVAAVETKSLGKAALREHLVPSAVSKRINSLEQSLGVVLLKRHAGGVEPTAAGLELAGHARNALLTLDRARGSMSRYADGSRGEVHLFSNTSAMVRGLPQQLGEFSARNPSVTIFLEEHRSPQIVNAVRDGAADFGICSALTPIEGLRLFPYKSARLMVITPTVHPLARRRKIGFGDTLEYDYIGWQERDSMLALLSGVAGKMNRQLKIRIKAGSLESLRQCVEAGLGIAIIPEYSVQRHVRSMHVRAIPLTDSWARVQLNICTRDVDFLPVSARLLLEHLLGRKAARSMGLKT